MFESIRRPSATKNPTISTSKRCLFEYQFSTGTWMYASSARSLVLIIFVLSADIATFEDNDKTLGNFLAGLARAWPTPTTPSLCGPVRLGKLNGMGSRAESQISFRICESRKRGTKIKRCMRVRRAFSFLPRFCTSLCVQTDCSAGVFFLFRRWHI